MAVQPKMSDLVGDLQAVSDTMEAFLDRRTGRIEMLTEDMEDTIGPEGAELERMIREDTTDRFVPLPTQFERDDFRIMQRFAWSRDDDRHCEKLEDALRGRGKYRRFKDRVIDLDIERDWFAFRDARYKQMMVDWCEEHNVDYIDDMPEADPADPDDRTDRDAS